MIVPCLHSWTFRTGAEGTFEDLALALHAADNDPGRHRARHDRRLDGDHEVDVPGALTTLDFAWDPIDAGHPARDHEVLTAQSDRAGASLRPAPGVRRGVGGARPVRDDVVAAVSQPDAQWPWTAQANADLRVRAIAGVGLQAGIDLQEQIVAAADRQWGPGAWTADLVGSLALGTAAAEASGAGGLPDDQPSQARAARPGSSPGARHRHPTATSLAGALTPPGPGTWRIRSGCSVPTVARAVGRDRLREAGG